MKLYGTMSRRDFVKSSLASLVASGLFTPRFSYALGNLPSSGKIFLSFHLDGGWDSLYAIPPFAASSFKTQLAAVRPNITVPDTSILNVLNGERGLHTNLGPLSTIFSESSAIVIRNANLYNQSMSHQQARMNIYNAGRNETPIAQSTGLFASIKNTWGTHLSTVFGMNAMPGEPGLNCEQTCPRLTGIASFNYKDRVSNLGGALDSQLGRETYKEMLLSVPSTTNPAFQAMRSGSASLDDGIAIFQAANGMGVSPDYPDTQTGRGLRDVAKILRWRQINRPAGECTFIEMSRGGFDTHEGQSTNLPLLLTELAAAFSVFISDLKAFNLWNNTAICIWPEFGRTTRENGTNGTDHARAGEYILMGGKVNGGVGRTVLGAEGSLAEIDQNWIQAKVEYQNILRGILSWVGFQSSDIDGFLIPEPPVVRQDYALFKP